MQSAKSNDLRNFLRRLLAFNCAVAGVISCLTLIGWTTGASLLTNYAPSFTAMNPTTAVALATLMVALFLRRDEAKPAAGRIFSLTLAAAATAVGALCFLSYLADVSIPIDQFLFGGSLDGNRIAPNTALCLALLGLSLLLIDRTWFGEFRPGQLAALGAAIVSFLSIVGYGYGTKWLYGIPSFIPMALPTAIAVHVLAWGVLCARPTAGLMVAVTSDCLGGVMARRLIPAALAFPVGLGWLRLFGEVQGRYDTELGVALYAVSTSFGFLAIVWWCARKLNAVDDERKVAQQDLRRLNEELELRVEQRTEELSAANRELMHKSEENDMFVFSVSHDLRSPLVNLQGFSQELTSTVDELRSLWQNNSANAEAIGRTLEMLDDDMQPSLRFIQAGVLRLSSIIDALLRLSRAGRIEYQIQAVDVEPMVKRIVDALQGSMKERGATVTIGKLPPAWGDASALEQVFGNLLSNAVNYLDAKRPGLIEVSAVNLPEADRDTVTYQIKDNGVGISALHQIKVFQAFQRLQPDLAKGEGMGLTMTRRIVERHDGRIWLESVEGTGTTFFVTLPAPPAEASSPAVVSPAAAKDSSSSTRERRLAHAN